MREWEGKVVRVREGVAHPRLDTEPLEVGTWPGVGRRRGRQNWGVKPLGVWAVCSWCWGVEVTQADGRSQSGTAGCEAGASFARAPQGGRWRPEGWPAHDRMLQGAY